jgi:hypothetical protein
LVQIACILGDGTRRKRWRQAAVLQAGEQCTAQSGRNAVNDFLQD